MVPARINPIANVTEFQMQARQERCMMQRTVSRASIRPGAPHPFDDHRHDAETCLLPCSRLALPALLSRRCQYVGAENENTFSKKDERSQRSQGI
jgi:hypothetical protein